MKYRARFWVELILGGITAVMAVVTVFWHDWIEIVTGLDPDAGSGQLEWTIVAFLALASIGAFILARIEWRRAGVRRTGT